MDLGGADPAPVAATTVRAGAGPRAVTVGAWAQVGQLVTFVTGSRRGEVHDLTTDVDAPYEPPRPPDLMLPTHELTVAQCVDRVCSVRCVGTGRLMLTGIPQQSHS